MTAASEDVRWMRRALELAAKGKGRVEPNPPVGAVIIRDGRLIGEAYHERFGGPHAEIRAMEAAGDCGGATLYVTLEPCTGLKKKTPPCCDAVIKAGFRRVVIGTNDPTQERALPPLDAAGIEVSSGVLEEDCRRMIAPFVKLRTKGMPYVIAKWAMTADGKIATVTGESRWISSEPARELVHQWRNQVDAVLIGLGAARRDDPLLTCRIAGGRNPTRIVLDANAELPADSRLISSIHEAPLIVACLTSAPEEKCRMLSNAGCRVLQLPGREAEVDVEALLRCLGAEDVTNLMIEGGGEVSGYLFDHGLVDEVRIFIAPKLFGGRSAPSPVGGQGILSPADALNLKHVTWTQVGSDMLLTGTVRQDDERR